MVKRVLLFTIILLLAMGLQAQTIGRKSQLNVLQDCRVKSLEEFTERFNGNEVPDFIKNSPVPQNRRTYVAALVNTDFLETDKGNPAVAEGFVDAVATSNRMVSMFDSNCYAEAHCLFAYKGKEIELSLMLQLEKIREYYYKWSIVGVNGLVEAGLIPQLEDGYISPLQHEFHFDDLRNAFPHVGSCCYANTTVDQLSCLIALCESGVLKYKDCVQNDYFFFEIPGYVFLVSQKNRQDCNSGWLISNIMVVPDHEKEALIEILLGKVKQNVKQK